MGTETKKRLRTSGHITFSFTWIEFKVQGQSTLMHLMGAKCALTVMTNVF
jgi:hypothetical protein